MYGLKKRSKQDENGLIQGAGTGTSDDIKKNVPAGSYIMPADSTKQIGTNNLKNMGSPTPVNLSNGEFQLSPEQVHSVGVQTLDAMKNQTHMPVDQPQLGFKPGQNKPELFFANGGVVPDLLKRRDQNPLMNQGIHNTLNNSFGKPPSLGSPQKTQEEKYTPPSFTESVVDDIGNNVGNEWKQENYARGMGQGVRGILSLPGAAAYDAFQPVGNFFGGLFNTDSSTTNNSNTQPIATKQPDPQKAADVTANNTVQTVDMFDLNQATTNQAQTQLNPYAIQQKGNSFSYANPSAAAQARADGVREGEGLGFKVRPVNDPRGVANLFANTQEMGPTEQQIQNAIAQREMNLGMQGYGGRPRLPDVRTSEQEAQLQAEIARVSAPIPGSKGLTASQRNQINDLQMGYSNRANDVYKTDANNAAALQREAMGQAGQNYRTELGEQGTNNRFNANLGFDAQKFQATNDLANREFNLNATEKGFGIRNSVRLEKLYEQYDSAKSDEDRKSIQEKINRYTGNKADAGKDRYMTVGGGQEYNKEEGVMINRPQQLFDTQTQQFVDTSNQAQQSVPQAAIEYLRKNPDQANYFNEMFGAGASDKYLKG